MRIFSTPSPISNERISFTADTLLGKGTGYSDSEFNNLIVELMPKCISTFASFNTYRITQSYQYEEGFLKESIEIFKKKSGREEPFIKIENEILSGKLPCQQGNLP